MRATVKLQDFNNALRLVAKPAGPYVQLNARSGQLTLASYSDMCHIKTRIEAQVDGEGGVCVLLLPPLMTFVRATSGMFKGDNIQAVLDIGDDWTGSLHIEDARAKLMGADPASYPVTEPPKGTGLTLDSAAFISAIEQVIGATGGSEVSPQFQGVCIAASDKGELRAMATDTRQAAVAVIGTTAEPWESVVLEHRDADLLADIARGQAQLQLWAGAGHRLWAHAGPHTLVTSTIVIEGGQFPDLPSRLAGPEMYDDQIMVDMDTWQPPLAAAIACNQGSADRVAQLTLSPDGVAVDVRNNDGEVHLPLAAKTQTLVYTQRVPVGRLSDRLKHAGPTGVVLRIPRVDPLKIPLRIEAPGYIAWVMCLAGA